MNQLRNKDIPLLARSCLEEYGATSFPVNLLHIADGMGVKVIKNSRVQVLLPDEYARCFYLPGTGRWIIIFDELRDSETKNFAIAHELGHIFLKHNKEYEHFQAYIKELERKHGLRVEKQANLFARHLLKGATAHRL